MKSGPQKTLASPACSNCSSDLATGIVSKCRLAIVAKVVAATLGRRVRAVRESFTRQADRNANLVAFPRSRQASGLAGGGHLIAILLQFAESAESVGGQSP